MMSWHYLPVWQEADGITLFGVYEVYVDETGRLVNWSVRGDALWVEDSLSELTGTVENILRDLKRWKPVCISDLEAGMKFEAQEDYRPEKIRLGLMVSRGDSEPSEPTGDWYRRQEVAISAVGQHSVTFGPVGEDAKGCKFVGVSVFYDDEDVMRGMMAKLIPIILDTDYTVTATLTIHGDGDEPTE